jgi:S1-C subfamily serine protease
MTPWLVRIRLRIARRAGAIAVVATALVLSACSTSSLSSTQASPTPGLSNSSTAAALDSAYTSVVDNVSPSVVLIETSGGLGSGEVYDTNGDIVTNAHVVGTETTFRVTTSSGKQLAGTLVGSFPPDDIAVIKVNGAGLKPATFGDSSKLKVGQPVIAIGNPLGLNGSVTSGVVSALGRVVDEGQGGGTLPDAVQTSAEINPGNSGGALVDLDSRVIGIPTLAALSPGTRGAQAPGIAFAISSDRARLIADQLVKDGKVTNSHRAYMGIQAGNTIGGKGTVVGPVQAGGPAASAGISEGDVITSVNGQLTPNTSALSTVLAGLSPGQTVPVAVTHPDGSSATINVTLAQLPG